MFIISSYSGFKDKDPSKVLGLLAKQGLRIYVDGRVERIDKLQNFDLREFDLVVDRIVVKQMMKHS